MQKVKEGKGGNEDEEVEKAEDKGRKEIMNDYIYVYIST